MLVSCANNSVKNNEIDIILPEDKDGLSEIVSAIKSIDVINLQIDSVYYYNENADLRVSDNYYYFINDDYNTKKIQLTCYEKSTGNLMFSRNIRGRARNECVELCNMYIMDDNFVINDIGKLKVFDHTGKMCDMLCNTEYCYLLPMGNAYVYIDLCGRSNNGNCILMLDSEFNSEKSYFKVPEEYMTGSYIRNLGNIYVLNDTLRFYCQYTFRLHYFPGDKTYHFITSHPIPESLLENPTCEAKSISFECLNNNYAHELYDLVENQDYISFKYMIGWIPNIVFLSKRDNAIYGIRGDSDDYEEINSQTLWGALLYSGDFIYSDGKSFYMKVPISVYDYFHENENLLDSRLKAVYESMRSIVDSGIGCSVFFCKVDM